MAFGRRERGAADAASPLRPPNLSRQAYDRFKEALFERRIEPGAFMSQAELVEAVGVPLGPLREALQVLQAEGLVTIKARAGIEIAKPDFALVRNTYQLRLILERPALRRFVEVAPAAAIDALEQGHRAVIAEIEGHELTRAQARAIETVDLEFHRAVIETLANPLLTRAYGATIDYVQLIRLDRHYGLAATMAVRTMHEHLAIMAACRARDGEAAEAALETHFNRAMQRAMGL